MSNGKSEGTRARTEWRVAAAGACGILGASLLGVTVLVVLGSSTSLLRDVHLPQSFDFDISHALPSLPNYDLYLSSARVRFLSTMSFRGTGNALTVEKMSRHARGLREQATEQHSALRRRLTEVCKRARAHNAVATAAASSSRRRRLTEGDTVVNQNTTNYYDAGGVLAGYNANGGVGQLLNFNSARKNRHDIASLQSQLSAVE